MNINLNVVSDEQQINMSAVTEEVFSKNMSVQNDIHNLTMQAKGDFNFALTHYAGMYLHRALPYNSDAKSLRKLVGCSFAWNQLYDPSAVQATTTDGVTFTKNADGSISVSGTATADIQFRLAWPLRVVANHKMLIKGCPSGGTYGTYSITMSGGVSDYGVGRCVINTSNERYIWIRIANGTAITTPLVFKPQFIDLTLALGAAVTDYIYGLGNTECATFFKNLFSKDYYPYDAGSIVSVKTSAHKMVGFNQWDEVWELGSINVNTGEDAVSTNTIRSKNHMRVVPNTTYYNKAPMNLNTIAYDANKQYLRRVHPIANRTYTIPEDVHYLRFYYGNSATPVTTYNHDVCWNIHLDGEREGEYEPYCVGSYAFDGSVELRGLLKLDANNKLYYDGDEYTADGTVKRKYRLVTLNGDSTYNYTQNGQTSDTKLCYISFSDKAFGQTNMISDRFTYNASNSVAYSMRGRSGSNGVEFRLPSTVEYSVEAFKAWFASNPATLIFELATPTTESATAYTQAQKCYPNGTEEFVDGRTVEVPVWNEADYLIEVQE